MRSRAAIVLSAAMAMSLAAPRAQEDGGGSDCGCWNAGAPGISTTQQDGHFGFRREDGKQIVPNVYASVDHFKGKYCRVYTDDGLCGMVDTAGRMVIGWRYQFMEDPAGGRVAVYRDGRVGYCHLRGEEVVGARYLQGASFSDGCAAVVLPENGKCAFIDTAGRQLWGATFDNVRPFHYGHAAVCRDGLWGMLARDGSIGLPLTNEAMTENEHGLFLAGKAGAMALHDKRMRRLTEPLYSGTLGCTEGRFSVMRDGRYGFADSTGREVVACQYDATGVYVGGYVAVEKDGKYGILDAEGLTLLPTIYDGGVARGRMYEFHDGRALVASGGKCTFVDTAGRLIMPLLLDDAYHYTEGLAAVRVGERWGYIDTAGDVYIPPVFEIASPFRDGSAEVVYLGQKMKIDRQGKCINNCNGIISWRELKE